MPAMVRPPSKTTKIAYAIVGIPSNMVIKRNKKKKKINQELLYQETSRVKGAY